MAIEHRLNDWLPPQSFVGFPVFKLRDPKVVWQNPAFADVDVLRLAYCAPVKGEVGQLSVHGDSRSALAERYGGEGLGRNGGGARCGLLVDYQIKGIGQNCLAGHDAEYFHSYGGATLNEAILEAIWGEACTAALPFGGVRTVAILATGTEVPLRFPKSSQSPLTPRALIIREGKIRPAHFMRAAYCMGQTAQIDGISDARRTKAAIASLPKVLQLLGLAGTGKDSSAIVFEGLNAALLRHATQIAAARAKRIMHGSLTPSNITLDGGWLDFGSISAVSDYGRVRIPRGAPDFLHEEAPIIAAVKDLYFYVGKYLPQVLSEDVERELQAALIAFRKRLNERFDYQLCLLSGIPEDSLSKVNPIYIQAFAAAARNVMESGNSKAFRILSEDNDVDPIMPPKMGDYHLNSILAHIAADAPLCEGASSLDSLLPNERLRCALLRSYKALIQEVAAGRERGCRDRLLGKIRLNALRRNATLDKLYRTKLYPHINDVVSTKKNCAAYINEMIGYASTCFDGRKDGECTGNARDHSVEPDIVCGTSGGMSSFSRDHTSSRV